MNKIIFINSIANQGYQELDKDFKVINLSTLSFKNRNKYTTYFNPITNSVVLIYRNFASFLNNKNQVKARTFFIQNGLGL